MLTGGFFSQTIRGKVFDRSRVSERRISLMLAEKCEVKIRRPLHFIFYPTSFCLPTTASQDAVSPILAGSIPLGVKYHGVVV